jgi:hypothetical protein
MKKFLLSMDLLSGGRVVETASHRGHGAPNVRPIRPTRLRQ